MGGLGLTALLKAESANASSCAIFSRTGVPVCLFGGLSLFVSVLYVLASFFSTCQIGFLGNYRDELYS